MAVVGTGRPKASCRTVSISDEGWSLMPLRSTCRSGRLRQRLIDRRQEFIHAVDRGGRLRQERQTVADGRQQARLWVVRAHQLDLFQRFVPLAERDQRLREV